MKSSALIKAGVLVAPLVIFGAVISEEGRGKLFDIFSNATGFSNSANSEPCTGNELQDYTWADTGCGGETHIDRLINTATDRSGP